MNKHIKKIMRMSVSDAIISENDIDYCTSTYVEELSKMFDSLIYEMNKFSILSKIEIINFDFTSFVKKLQYSNFSSSMSLSKMLNDNDLFDVVNEELSLIILSLSKNNKSIKKYYNKFLNEIVTSALLVIFILEISTYLTNIKKISKNDTKEQLVKLLAFLYHNNLIDFSCSNEETKSLNLIKKIKDNCYEVKVIQSSRVDENSSYTKSKQSTSTINDLINRCMVKTKYVNREPEFKGKHLSHKSPIPHIRKGHYTSLRNGRTSFIKTVLVNSDEASFELIERFEQISIYEAMFIKKQNNCNSTFYNQYTAIKKVA